jgi:hypothetical protein
MQGQKKGFCAKCIYYVSIQGVSEIGALILTGNRTRQKEQLFYLPFFRRKTINTAILRSALQKKIGEIFH